MNNSIKKASALGPLYRGLPIIFLCILGGVFMARKYFQYATPQFESTAKIKLADPHDGVTDSKLYKDVDVFVSSNKLGAEVELLKSKVLIRKAIAGLPLATTIYRVGKLRKTELYTQTPFWVKANINNPKLYDTPFKLNIYKDSLIELKNDSVGTFRSRFNHVINMKGASLVICKNDKFLNEKTGVKINDHYQFIVHSENKLLDGIADDLDVMSVDKDIPVLRISYKCPVPQEAADIVNSLSVAYINDYIEQKSKSADTTENFLNRELKNYSGNLSTSENDIENYRNKNNIINIQQETETDLRKIADLKKQLANVKMNLNAADSLNRYISTGKDHFLKLAPNYEEFTDLLSTEMVKKIEELTREREDLLLKYTPANEKVKVIDNKLQDICNYFQESIKNTENSLRIKYNDLQKSIDDAEQAFVGLPGKEKNMTILGRNFGLNDEIYRSLHEKRTEAQIAKAATISFHRIISEGEVPEKPVSPNRVILTILAAILGLFGGIGFVYSVHTVKGRVNNPETINRLSDIIIAAAVPYLKKQTERLLFFKSWALELELKGNLKTGAVIAISSFDRLEGKSFITNHLFDAASLLDKSILLINAAEQVSGEFEKPANWKKYIDEQKGQYDLLLIKNVTLQNHPIGIMIMANSDLNLFILDSRRTKKARIEEADLLNEELHLPNVQFVLNRAGYIPSLFTQVKGIFSSIFKRR